MGKTDETNVVWLYSDPLRQHRHTCATWFIRYIKYRGYSDFGILFTYSVLAVPFVLSLIFLLSGLCLCIFELVRDYKQK